MRKFHCMHFQLLKNYWSSATSHMRGTLIDHNTTDEYSNTSQLAPLNSSISTVAYYSFCLKFRHIINAYVLIKYALSWCFDSQSSNLRVV